jgi:peptidyl-prolyl cis-trans isomerase SurA
MKFSKPSPSVAAACRRRALDQQVLERLIVENLQLQIGERSGIRITDEELNQAVGTIAQRNNMSVDQFRAALAHDGLSYDDARDQIKREMIISRVRQRRVAERIQVSEQEVKNFLAPTWARCSCPKNCLANILIPTPESANSEAIQALPSGDGRLPATQARRRLRSDGHRQIRQRQRPGRRRHGLA